MQNIKSALCLIIILSVLRCPNAFTMEIPEEVAEQVAWSAASIIGQESFKEACKTIFIPLGYISLARELYILGKGTKSLLLPTEKVQSHSLEVNKELRLIRAKKAFENCLINARSSNQLDDCKETEFMFASLAGRDKAKRKKAVFNKYKK